MTPSAHVIMLNDLPMGVSCGSAADAEAAMTVLRQRYEAMRRDVVVLHPGHWHIVEVPHVVPA